MSKREDNIKMDWKELNGVKYVDCDWDSDEDGPTDEERKSLAAVIQQATTEKKEEAPKQVAAPVVKRKCPAGGGL